MIEIDKKVLPVWQLVQLEGLSIPNYQRPYRWGHKNINDLFSDIQKALSSGKSSYRLGSVVFHRRKDQSETTRFDIVDGQQRTLTLILAVRAIIERRLNELIRPDLKQRLEDLQKNLKKFVERQQFSSRDSEVNLRRNYQELVRLVDRPEFSEDHIDFLLNRCEAVTFVLDDVSEAFQFFDSQNARGRDLAPHDLLKAFHLREFPDHEAELKADAVSHWECLQTEALETLFATYLYRVRQWGEGKSARFFGKGDVDLFKGINLDRVGYFPYVESLRIAHHFVDDYNRNFQRKIDGQKMRFPFHLDQMIVNGRRFFEMAKHYQQLVAAIIEGERANDDERPVIILGEALGVQASKIIKTLNRYKQRNRTGDRYVRAMFDCALIFYIDKFGTQGLSHAIEKCFIWAYSCRIRQQVVQIATVDNYVLDSNLIRAIRDARLPEDLHAFPLPTINIAAVRNSQTGEDELIVRFREMKYYE